MVIPVILLMVHFVAFVGTFVVGVLLPNIMPVLLTRNVL